MAEDPTPLIPPVPSPSPSKREHGLLNKIQAEKLTKAEQISARPPRKPPTPPRWPPARHYRRQAHEPGRACATAYLDANSAQSAAQSDATTQRTNLETMIASIKDRRIIIQFAADAEWPWSTKVNAGIRKQFSLPAGRPFGG